MNTCDIETRLDKIADRLEEITSELENLAAERDNLESNENSLVDEKNDLIDEQRDLEDQLSAQKKSNSDSWVEGGIYRQSYDGNLRVAVSYYVENGTRMWLLVHIKDGPNYRTNIGNPIWYSDNNKPSESGWIFVRANVKPNELDCL